jgi:hypothetical protein
MAGKMARSGKEQTGSGVIPGVIKVGHWPVWERGRVRKQELGLSDATPLVHLELALHRSLHHSMSIFVLLQLVSRARY